MTTEALRLQARADEAEERLDALLSARERAADTGAPAPSAETIAAARKLVDAARAAADAARRSDRAAARRGRR